MEAQFPSFQIISTFFIFIFILFKLLKPSKNGNSAPKLPPGPWKLPLIGSMHHLARSLPHRRLTDLAKKYGPIMHLKLGEVDHIVISSPETAKEVMKTHDIIFAQRPRLLAASFFTYDYTDIAFAPQGDYWRQVRKICTLELLTAKRVQSFKSIREEELSKLIKSLASSAGSPVNFSQMFTSMTYSINSKAAFGKVRKGGDIFISFIKKVVREAGGFTLADVYPSIKVLPWLSGMVPRLQRLQQPIDKVYQTIIDDHRARRAAPKSGEDEQVEDLVDVLLKFQEQGDLEVPITDDNIKAVILDIFSGGSDTSSTTVDWAMSELLRSPRAMEKAQEEVRRVFGAKGDFDEEQLHELNYLKLVVKETLRLHPPLPLLLPRECKERCVINGYDIPINSKVIVNAWAIGRDPNYWTESKKFYPERFQNLSIDYKGNNFEYLPFDSGKRICPGLLFGLINAEWPLAKLLYHFDWKLPAGVKPQTLDMNEVFGAVVKRENDLHLIPIPYQPSLIE